MYLCRVNQLSKSMSIVKNPPKRSGHIGNEVFRDLGDRVVMQAMPSCYTDKKSEAQLKQRSGMKNILAMYRKVKEAVSGCFEERHGKQRDYNCFVSHNLLQSPVPMSKKEYRNGETILAPYVISSGSLPSLDYEWKDGRLSFL